MERVVEPPEHAGRVQASAGEQGQSRHRRDDGGGAAGLAEGELGTGPRGTARGDVPADSRCGGR